MQIGEITPRTDSHKSRLIRFNTKVRNQIELIYSNINNWDSFRDNTAQFLQRIIGSRNLIFCGIWVFGPFEHDPLEILGKENNLVQNEIFQKFNKLVDTAYGKGMPVFWYPGEPHAIAFDASQDGTDAFHLEKLEESIGFTPSLTGIKTLVLWPLADQSISQFRGLLCFALSKKVPVAPLTRYNDFCKVINKTVNRLSG